MKSLTFLFSLCLVITSQVHSQIDIPAASPEASITQTIGFTEMTVTYNRPLLKGRDMFKELTRPGEVWRTGANMATRMTLSNDLSLNGQLIPAGEYSLYSIPGKETWTLIINKKIQWGTQYDSKEDLVRLEAPVQQLKNKVESFTFYFSDVTEDYAEFGFMWGNMLVAFDLEVNIHDKIVQQINTVMSNPATATDKDYFSAARYYIDHDMDPDKALKWANIFAERMKEHYWAHGLKASAEAHAGKYADAIATAKNSIAMAEEAGNSDYVHKYSGLIESWSNR